MERTRVRTVTEHVFGVKGGREPRTPPFRGGDYRIGRTTVVDRAGFVSAASRTATVTRPGRRGRRTEAHRFWLTDAVVQPPGAARPAADAVRSAVAEPGCATETAAAWRPSKTVLGAKPPVVKVAPSAITVDVTAIEAASARVCLLPGSHTLSSARRMLAGRAAPAGCATAAVTQNRWASVRLPRLAGRVTVAVRLAAETNPARSTTVVRPIR